MDSLIDTETLERELDDPSLRIFDSTIQFAAGGTTRSGLADWEEGHIPGSRFVDLMTEFSEPDRELPFTRPTSARLDRVLGQLGIAGDSKIIVYSAGPGSAMWATRLWWLLSSAGLENVALLDGGYAKWQREKRPISTEACRHPETKTKDRAKGRSIESWWATQDEVLSAVGDGSVCTLNALPRSLFTGEVEMGYSRPGRITGSENAPFTGVLDPEPGTLRNDAELREHFQMIGPPGDGRVISYCGGGIAATLNGFALRRLGYSNVGVYDGSLNEWSRDPKLPMETGD